jgi:hypothetical protein
MNKKKKLIKNNAICIIVSLCISLLIEILFFVYGKFCYEGECSSFKFNIYFAFFSFIILVLLVFSFAKLLHLVYIYLRGYFLK